MAQGEPISSILMIDDDTGFCTLSRDYPQSHAIKITTAAHNGKSRLEAVLQSGYESGQSHEYMQLFQNMRFFNMRQK